MKLLALTWMCFSVIYSIAAIADSNVKITPDGMVEYDHAVDQKYGYFDIYLPKLKSSDGTFNVFSLPEDEVKLDSDVDVLFPNPFALNKTDSICASFGLSRNRSHVSTWGAIDSNERFVRGHFEAPQSLKKHWWGRDKASKLIILHCENIYDSSRNNGIYPGAPIINVIGGTVIISHP